MAAGRDHYAILGVDREADFQAIKKAYYRRAKECHPDLFGGDRGKEEAFKRLVAAFDVLSDPLTRRRYDAGLAAAREPFAGTVADAGGKPPPEDWDAILDTHADDALEELIVGNTIPRDATLATLMLDLTRTERFCLFREAKTCYYNRDHIRAAKLFVSYLKQSPNNILGHYFLARSQMRLGLWRKAARELRRAITIGKSRTPPLRLGRMRRELETLRRRHGGWLDRLRQALASPTADYPVEDPEADMRRQVGRSINRLARHRPPQASTRPTRKPPGGLLPPAARK